MLAPLMMLLAAHLGCAALHPLPPVGSSVTTHAITVCRVAFGNAVDCRLGHTKPQQMDGGPVPPGLSPVIMDDGLGPVVVTMPAMPAPPDAPDSSSEPAASSASSEGYSSGPDSSSGEPESSSSESLL